MVLTLRAEGLRFAYPGGRLLLDGVSLGLMAGQVLCLLGPNGTGKTTLLRCLLGLVRPQQGRVELGGQPLDRLRPAQIARGVAYVPQESAAGFAFTAGEMVLMGRTPHLRLAASPGPADRQQARAAMLRLGIAHLAGRPFPELSGGERQLVLVARALAQGARTLVLDEPCAGLDIANQLAVIRTVRRLADDGYAVMLTTHLPDHAFALGGVAAMLKAGRLLGPAAPELLLDAATLGALYGTAIDVIRVAEGPAQGQMLCVPVLDGTELRAPAPGAA